MVIFVVLSGTNAAFAQRADAPRSMSQMLDSLQLLSDYIQEHLSEFTPAELKKQQEIRLSFQRQGYPNIVYDVMQQDGWSALVSYAKVHLFMEFSMEHKYFWIVTPIDNEYMHVEGILFPDDWSFSPDPWKRK